MNMDFRHISLIIAESIDAWRVIPRAILIIYGTLVFKLYIWFRSIPTYVQEQCDSDIITSLMNSGISLEEAKVIACQVIDVVGGPTSAQSAFVTTIIGLSTGIFGLYVATGRKWERGLPNDNRPPQPIPPPYYDGDDRNPRHPHNPHNPPNKPPHSPYGPRHGDTPPEKPPEWK
jgi:hypothetical protein